MLILARHLPLRIPSRHRHDLFQLEALFFGVSGLNDKPIDDYSKSLAREADFLIRKYSLRYMDKSIWKFFRLRPPSFPTLRLAQLAALFHERDTLFSIVKEVSDVREFKEVLRGKTSFYWNDHFRFNRKTKMGNGSMGEGFVNLLVINVIIPFLFEYGRKLDQTIYKQRALDLLEQLPAEDNKIIQVFRQLNVKPNSAFQSQGLIHLYKNYCEPKKCLNCAIGMNLLRNDYK